jgi:hypothetical protein
MKFFNQPSESSLLLLISLLGALSVSLHSVLAADGDASLDQMWKDPSTQSTTQSTTESTTDQATQSSSDAATGGRITLPEENTTLDKPLGQSDSQNAPTTKFEPTKANAPEPEQTAAPQTSNVELKQRGSPDASIAKPEKTAVGDKHCSLDKFIHSAVVLGTGWPGIGKFQAVQPGPNTYVDGARNRLGLSVEQENIVAAELDLASAPNPNQNFFNVEMGVDFLLEGLGTQATKINDINLAIEKMPQLVNGQASVPSTELSTGDYLIFLERPDAAGDYRIKVREPAAVNVQIAMADPIPVPEKVSVMPAGITRKVPPLPTRPKAPAKPPKAAQSPETPAKPADNPASKYEDLLNQLQDNNATSDNSPRGIAGADLELKKKVFLETLQKWQRLKKVAVRQRETTELSQALSGKALKRQSDSIKWLAENHKYFDTTPKGIVVERVVAVEPEKKYEVYALVKEQNKYVDDVTSQVLKETEEVNNVKYVVELNGDHWLIVDSALLKPANQVQPSPAKPQH